MSSPKSLKGLTLVETIQKHIVEEGECWNWTGAMQACGTTPTMRWQGQTGSVRRFILIERSPNQRNRSILLATYTCGNPKCVHPEHTGWAARRSVQNRTAAEQQYHSDVIRCKKLADSARKHAKLTMEIADQVREAEGPQHQIAERFGISQATVSRLKRNEIWKTYGGNPFAGLGARA
jgi:predicted XRE-type DNA-binding protein